MTTTALPRSTETATCDDVVEVMLVEDHPLMMEAIAGTLEASGLVNVVAKAADGPDAVTTYRDSDRDRRPLVLCDLGLPSLDGLAVLRALLEIDSNAAVILFTAYDDRTSLVAAIDAGARGFIAKSAEPDDLVRALHAAAAGDIVYDARTAHALASERTGVLRGDVRNTPLTVRELEVLQALSRGLSTSEVAGELYLGAETVRTHIKQILRKLDVSDRTGAVAKAMRCRLVS